MKLIIGVVGLALFAMADLAEAQIPGTTLVRSWRYTYTIPEGLTVDNPRAGDYHDEGLLIHVRLLDGDGEDWYQIVWVDGTGSELWKSDLRASVHFTDWGAFPGGIWFVRNVRPEDTDYQGRNESKTEVIFRNEDGTFTETTFAAFEEAQVVNLVGQSGLEELESQGYHFSLGRAANYFQRLRQYDPRQFYEAEMFAYGGISEISESSLELGSDILGLGETTPIEPEQPETPPTLVADVVSGVSGANLLVRWKSEVAATYQVQSSPDLNDWQGEGQPFNGTGQILQWATPITETDKFLRVVLVN